jgi:2-haloacid dehalogenase
MAAERWATFDCYGTLIDWNGGIRAELARLFGEDRADELLHRYHEIEPEAEAEDPSLSYREVMTRVLARLGDVPPGDEGALGRSLPEWHPFPEVPASLEALRDRGWRLAILSNTDRDLIEASKQALGVPFDETVVAGEIGSYKPAPKHWDEFFARTGADREQHVHVAASLFHDIAPANGLGLRSVWINRLGERPGPEPTRELTDLRPLPGTLDELVPIPWERAEPSPAEFSLQRDAHRRLRGPHA